MTAMTKKGISLDMLMRMDDDLTFNVMEGTVTRLTQADTADADAMALTGWQDAALAGTDGGVTQEAVIYSDIQRSVTAFSAMYPYTVDEGGDG